MHRKNPNRKFSLRFGKEETSTEDKKPCLQGFVPSWSFLTRLRRPYLFRLAGKDRGEKGAWMRLVLSASEFRREPIFQASFHTIVTLRVSDYAPPDTGVSNLQLVSVEYLPSIEGATELLMGATFLRGPCSGAIIRQRSTANSGWRSLCGDQSSISSNASSPFLASALTSPWRTKSMVTKLRATNSAA